jgi:hypothetical protein
MTSTSSWKSKRNTIEEPMQKQEISTFTNTECRVNKRIAFKWNTLFQAFQKKKSFNFCYKMILVHNLAKAYTKVLPSLGYIRACPDVIEWMTQRIDHGSRIILNFKDKHVAIYQAPVLNHLYHSK